MCYYLWVILQNEEIFTVHLIKHECGNPLWMESHACGHCYTVEFFDARKDTPNKKLSACPTCGQSFGEEEIEPDTYSMPLA